MLLLDAEITGELGNAVISSLLMGAVSVRVGWGEVGWLDGSIQRFRASLITTPLHHQERADHAGGDPAGEGGAPQQAEGQCS